jgi:hypothetical protein
MTLWGTLVVASLLSFGIKFSGYLVPQSLFERPTFTRITNLLTVAMLAALVAVQTLAVGQSIEIDARVPAVIVASIMFSLRVPFIIVVIVAGLIAVALRYFGIMG